MANIWDIPLALSNFNIVLAVLGGFLSLFGLVSYLLKETCYLSEALISLLAGVALGPHAANFIRPSAYASSSAQGSDSASIDNVDVVTLNFSRLVLGIQLIITGIELPNKYLWKQWKPMSLLLGPGMACMWLASSFLIWGLVGTPSLLHAMVVGACVTPTDPILCNVIVQGRFADTNVPKDLQDLIVAESGANDGLGYPFLFLALYLIKYVGPGAASGGAADAMGLWFAFTWGYTIILSVVYGAMVGWLAKELLYWARRRNYVDRESFLFYAISLALFVTGTCGLVGTDDILACLIAGSAFNWDSWFRKETKHDSLQPTFVMILNITIFLWYGAVIPWAHFRENTIVSIGRLIALGILISLFRRLPWIFGMHKWIPQIRGTNDALFVGFFGPTGVSAVFYLFTTLEFIQGHLSDDEGVARSDVKDLGETVRVVVWFLTVTSIVVHGLSIPLAKMGGLTPKMYKVLSESLSPYGSRISSRVPTLSRWMSSSVNISVNVSGTDVEAADGDRDRDRDRIPGMSDPEQEGGGAPAAPPGSIAVPAGVRPARPAVVRDARGAGSSLEPDTSMPAQRREIRFYDEP